MQEPARSHWRGVGVAFLAGVAAATALAKASPAALDLRSALHLTLAQIGWVMSAGTIATFALGVVSGQLGHWRGSRGLLRDGLLVLVVAGALSALAPATAWLLAGRGLEGVGVVLITVAAPTLIASLTRRQDIGLAMGVWALWMPVGSMLMLALAPLLLGAFGWRGLWSVSAVAALAVLAMLPGLPRDVGLPSGGRLDLSVLRSSGPWWLALAFFCFSSQFFSVFTFLPTHLMHTLGLDTATATLASALVPAAIIPGNLLGGVLVHRGWRPSTLLVLPALPLLVVLPAMMLFAHSLGWTYLLLASYGFLLGIIPTGIFTQAPLLAPRPPATGPILGLALSGQGLGILVGPPLVGTLLEKTGSWLWPVLLLGTALLGLVTCALMLRHAGGRHKPAH
ncbi:MFS transporter [Immundisolibacter sp.]|uniref:MFS transporter n=1 Tax=Immundisolibacter sp. TaxID=1934948 RepID=UPI002B122E84|nr:MFS transporter [Immundisolibacter sp.]MEA3219911.1 putative transporter YycB [Immundisolibacter sp.]